MSWIAKNYIRIAYNAMIKENAFNKVNALRTLSGQLINLSVFLFVKNIN